jgi:hypothetical protein
MSKLDPYGIVGHELEPVGDDFEGCIYYRQDDVMSWADNVKEWVDKVEDYLPINSPMEH